MAGLGTYRSTDTGAMFTFGSKRNRIIAFECSTEDIERFARRSRDRMPELLRKAEGRAASGCRAQIRRVMKIGGGEYGVPKFRPYNPFTLQLHPSWNKHRIGGILAESGAIVMYKKSGVQYVGWPDYLHDTADKFQEGRGGEEAEKYFTDSQWRHNWHRRGLDEIPRAYVHNPRQVLSHYAERLDRNLGEFKEKVLKKLIATELAKAAQQSGGYAV